MAPPATVALTGCWEGYELAHVRGGARSAAGAWKSGVRVGYGRFPPSGIPVTPNCSVSGAWYSLSVGPLGSPHSEREARPRAHSKWGVLTEDRSWFGAIGGCKGPRGLPGVTGNGMCWKAGVSLQDSENNPKDLGHLLSRAAAQLLPGASVGWFWDNTGQSQLKEQGHYSEQKCRTAHGHTSPRPAFSAP